MKKRVIKLIVCVVLISALMVGFCSAYASAALPNASVMQRFNAWVASALVAANITIGSTIAPVQQLLDSLSYGADMPWTPQYTYSGPTWDDDIMDRSVITVFPDVVTIDGVTYTDVWLSNDAAQKFRVNAFDAETAWNIASNSNGTYASGVGYCSDVPIFNVNGVNRSQDYSASFPTVIGGVNTYSIGDYTINLTRDYFSTTNLSYQAQAYVSNPPGYSGSGAGLPTATGTTLSLRPYSNSYAWYYTSPRDGTNVRFSTQGSVYTASPFDFDWVSGLVPAEQLGEDEQLHFRIPSSYDGGSGSTYNYDIHDLININPNISQPGGYELNFDPSLNPNYQLDLDTNDALGAIISAVIAAYLADLLDGDGVKIEYTVNEPSPPEPGVIDPLPDPDPAPDDPTPGTTISNTDWTKLDEILRWIQSTIDSIRHLTESLQTMLDNIIEAMRDILQQIAEIPDVIRELADKILEDIELGPAKLFDKALDILKTLFLPLLLPIRAMMNLWHYVVEWIQSITTPFTWIFGIMSGTSGNLVLPIYALLAGGICISIYKALGR